MKRIQRQRTKGWRMPENAVYVGRPSLWGNPFPIDGEAAPWLGALLVGDGREAGRRQAAVIAHRSWISGEPIQLPPDHDRDSGGVVEFASGAQRTVGQMVDGLAVMMVNRYLPPLPPKPDLGPLRGKDLVCWCPLDQPCHADVLLELANGAAA